MEFVSTEHEKFYESHENITTKGSEYQALIYTLGINRVCREHIKDIYNESSKCIKPDAITKAWQTNSSVKITRLAINLFTWGIPEEDKAEMYAPKELLSGLDAENRAGVLFALTYFA